MWEAAAVAVISIFLGALSFFSRGKAIKKVGALEAQRDEADAIIEALLVELQTISRGDYGLEHDDMARVVFPGNLRDDSVDDA